jgi:hypothetical protein
VVLEADWRPFSAAIVDEARRWSAELIALGTHGRTGLARLALGSVAERVIHIAPVPILLVRHHRGAAGSSLYSPRLGSIATWRSHHDRT